MTRLTHTLPMTTTWSRRMGRNSRSEVQGSFLVVRPYLVTRHHLLALVYSSTLYGGFGARISGWLHSGYGRHILGVMIIQGLTAHYFNVEQVPGDVQGAGVSRYGAGVVSRPGHEDGFGDYPIEEMLKLWQ